MHRLTRAGVILSAVAGALCLCTPSALTEQSQAANYGVTVRTDRSNALYHAGETVHFLIRLSQGGRPANGTADWIVTKDGVPPTRQGRVTLTNGEAVVNGTLDEPGFLLCRATFETPDGQTLSDHAGAGFEPLLIKASMPVPEDFDAFWDAQKRKLARVPSNPRLNPVPPQETVESFDVQLDCVGAPVSGYFSRPKGANPKSLPAILSVHGAGVRSSSLPFTVSWAKDGLLAMDINAHGIPNGKPAEYYQELAQGELKGYSHRGRESRDTCYFLGMYLRVVRAIDFLASQPEWDGQTLVVQGSSQGGAQAIAAAGLDSRVSFFTASVPAMCDHTGMIAGRICGWPKLVPISESGPDPAVLQAARYFDSVNFATRAKAAALFTVGFIDTTCPPSSVYAAYNALNAPKDICNDVRSRHENTPGANAAVRAAILRHLKKAQ